MAPPDHLRTRLALASGSAPRVLHRRRGGGRVPPGIKAPHAAGVRIAEITRVDNDGSGEPGAPPVAGMIDGRWSGFPLWKNFGCEARFMIVVGCHGISAASFAQKKRPGTSHPWDCSPGYYSCLRALGRSVLRLIICERTLPRSSAGRRASSGRAKAHPCRRQN